MSDSWCVRDFQQRMNYYCINAGFVSYHAQFHTFGEKKSEQRLQQQMTLDFVATDFSLGTQIKTECLSGKVKNGCFFNHLKGYAQHLSDANIVIVNRTVTNIHSLARSLGRIHPYSKILILPIAPTAKHIAFVCNIPSFYQQLSVVLHLMLVNAFL